MDRRSTKSLRRDYGVPMQDPNAFSLQYGKETTKDPSKPVKKPGKKKKENSEFLKDKSGLLKLPVDPSRKQYGGKIVNKIEMDKSVKEPRGLLVKSAKKGTKVGNPENRNKAGGSNVGKYSKSEGPFAGPAGGSPAGSYPIGSKKRGKSALKLAHNAPNPGGIKAAVYRKYPDLKPGKAMEGAKLGLGGMGRMQDKAPQPTKRNAPPDKIKQAFGLYKRYKKQVKFTKPAFPH